MVPIFLAKIDKGRVVIEDKDAFNIWLTQFEGKIVEMIVRKKKRPRSTGRADEKGNQNGYYWGVILPIIANYMGQTVDETNEDLLSLYAPKVPKQVFGKTVMHTIRGSEMDTVQFMEYCDTIIRIMAGFQVVIPEPKKVYY